MTQPPDDRATSPWSTPVPQPPDSPAQRGIDVPAYVSGLALVVMVAAFLVIGPAVTAGSKLFGGSAVAGIVLGSLALYGMLGGTCWWVSRRHGTAAVRADFGLTFERGDPLRGLGYSLLARLGLLIAAVLLATIDRRFAKSNLEGLDLTRNIPASIALAVAAVVVAPVLEELFFRGLLLRALKTAIGTNAAVVGQALLFGGVHAGAIYGLGNVGIVTSTVVLGLVLGYVVERHGRLGPAIWTHAIFNASSLLLLLAIT